MKHSVVSISITFKKSLGHIFNLASALRGALGYQLRSRYCKCLTDSHRDDCEYAYLFEGQTNVRTSLSSASSPIPFVIRVSQYCEISKTATIELVVYGDAIKFKSNLVSSLIASFSAGIGPNKEAPNLVGTHEATADESRNTACEDFTLKFFTPVLLKKNSRLMPLASLNARDIIVSIARRQQLLRELYGATYQEVDFKSISSECAGVSIDHSLKLVKWHRYSARQQRKQFMAGFIGDVRLHHPKTNSIDIHQVLVDGQFSHVGGKSALGLGYYKIA